MSDIFREVEEEVRRERLTKLWKKYGDYAIAVAAVLIIGVAGFKLWQHYQFVQTQKASAAYLQALELSGAGRAEDTADRFAKIAKTAPSGYALVAQMSQANTLLAAGKTQEAIALYKKIADKDSKDIGEAARIRAAWALADNTSKAELEKLLEPLNTDTSGWRFMAREILAYADFRDGRLKESGAAYGKIAADAAAPAEIRQRAQAMAMLIRTGVGDYGILPAPDPASSGPASSDKGAAPSSDASSPNAASTTKGNAKK